MLKKFDVNRNILGAHFVFCTFKTWWSRKRLNILILKKRLLFAITRKLGAIS